MAQPNGFLEDEDVASSVYDDRYEDSLPGDYFFDDLGDKEDAENASNDTDKEQEKEETLPLIHPNL